MAKRARARYRDKLKLASGRVHIGLQDFVSWYEAQDDCCAYCGLTFAELKRLKIRRGGGYCVSWDIDRIDSSRPYEPGNVALSCFVCNMATVVTLDEVGRAGEARFQEWLSDRRSARQVPHRLEAAGYVRVRNPDAKDGLWRVAGRRQVIYGLHDLPTRDLIVAARQN